jgi:hypothetical protein
MSKDPAVLFYTSDFISGTLTMTDEQRGKYIILLCLQHQQGLLSHDDMMNICKTYDSKIFGKFLKTEDGFYFNERMKEESDKRKKFSESRKRNRAGGLQKEDGIEEKNAKSHEEHVSNMCETHDGHMENENENINENINNKKSKMKEVFVLPDWIPENVWHEYLKTRDKKKAAKTPYALNLVVTELQKIKDQHNHDPVDVLNKVD